MEKYEIEFLEKEHIYLVNGVIIPSVTQIIKRILPNKYKDIDEEILKKAGEFGTKGHKIIETIGKNKLSLDEANNYCSNLYESDSINQQMSICLREFIRLSKENKIEMLENEKIVNYKYEFIGTLDMIANVNGIRSLIDIKFTSKLDEEYLAWQLGMYEMASGEVFKKHYCLWLPKGKIGKLAEIKIKTKKEIINKLKELGDEDNGHKSSDINWEIN